MVGEDAIETRERRWATFIPVIVRLGDQDEDEDASYKEFHIQDKQLRGTGIGAKSPAVFAEYDVSRTQSINDIMDIATLYMTDIYM